MIKQYETVFIATPVLSEAQMKEAVKKYTDYIVSKGGEIVYEEDWGLKQLAYPIQKKTTGFYYLIEFKADTQVVAKLETQYRRDERIMRFLNEQGKILPRRLTGTSLKFQRKVAQAVKRARHLALLPYVTDLLK